MPALGLGTWLSQPNEVFEAVLTAIKTGYRHIDCAHIYKNEKEIGEALHKAFRDGLVKREGLWVTSKLWNDSHLPEHVLPSMETTLKNLRLDYLDLYLIHWPVSVKKGIDYPSRAEDFLRYEESPLTATWESMEKLVEKGLTKHIGVSNFNILRLEEILSSARILPEVNQVELHPYLPQQRLKEFCEAKGIYLTAYGPLGAAYRVAKKEVSLPILLEDKAVKAIAEKHKATPAQVLLAWGMERGTAVIPKSVNPVRIKENFGAIDIELDNEDMEVLASLEGPYRYTPGPVWLSNGSPYTSSDLWEEYKKS
jgi:alcohol dehydrogenase (NADP+)